MKAFQRILAVLLCLVMSLGMISMVASAEETMSTIDTTRKGSITVHKYEYNGDAELKHGDGTTNSANDLPADANPLAGAGFTVYKVADLSYLDSDYPAISDYVNADGTIKDASKKVGNEVKTGTDGIAKFENLALGLYVVIETTTPDAVTKSCDPFFVSVPMTEVDGDGWLYDIHVYPKNKTTYGELELVKKGNDGNVLQGVEFYLQKKNDDGSWTNITKKAGAAGDNTGDALNLVTNANGKITVAGLSKGTYRFIEKSVGNNYGYIMDGAATYEFVVNANASITYKGETNAAITINVVNDKPDMDKQVKDKNGTAQEAADYSVGDDVPYVVTIDVPANIEKLTTFTLSDTLTNQKYNKDLAIAGLTKGEDYTIVESDTGYTVTFVTANLAGKTSLTVTYTAELLNTAVTTTVGNPNSAVLTYSNKIIPNTDDDNPNEGGTPSNNTITDETVVYTFELKVDKDDENGAPLANVEFDVYAYNGTATTVTEAELKANGTKVASIKTDAQGLASVPGLENGKYYLVETKTVAGYNLLQAPVEVELNISYKTTWTESNTYDNNGNLIKHDVDVKNETFNGKAVEGKGFVTKTIVNRKGFLLPQTGGIGTLMFVIIGGVLMAGGICLIVPNKKRAI